jgi:hypothetical protein
MTTVVIIVVAIVVIALIVVAAMAARRRRLQQQFGPEYDRVVSERESRLRGEAELSERQRRVRKLDIQPLSEAARTRYLAQWQVIQEQFVDSPEEAVTNAYALVTTVMRERGYPVDDDEQVQADLSVEHAATVGHFRSAQEITRNIAHGSVTTEDLRQAFIHYRALFSDLLGQQVDPAAVTAAPDGYMANGEVPADDAVAVSRNAAAPADDTVAADDTVVPADDTVVPAEEVPADDVSVSRDDRAVPADGSAAYPAATSTEPNGLPVTDDEYAESDAPSQPQGR